MPHDFEPKKLKMKRGDIRVKTRGGLTTLVWKDRREAYMLTNMDPPPAEGNFCDDSNRPVKPQAASRSSITNGCRAKTERPSGLSNGLFGSGGTNEHSSVANSHANSFPAAPALWRPYFSDHPRIIEFFC